MGRYPRKTKRASKKSALSQKASKKLKPKTVPVSCPYCGARSGRPCKNRQEPHVARTKKYKEVQAASRRKKAAAKKTRGRKNQRIVKRVNKRNKTRDKSRTKKLSAKKRRELNKQLREEKRRIEEQRLFDEKLRQIRDEKQRQAASKAEIVSTLQKRFDALLSEAKRTKQLPSIPRQRVINSARLKGFKRHVNVSRILLPEEVEDIMHMCREKAVQIANKPAQGWLAVINFASLGESLLGYGQIVLSSSLPGASLFQVQGIESSGMHNTREGMLISLENKLEDLASETSATVYINFIAISAYTRRS